MKFLFFIVFIPTILSAPLNEIIIKSDDDCWSNAKNNTVRKGYGILVKFSPTVAYGTDDCSVHISNPWLPNMQNGFGLFLSRTMDCASTLTIDCLPDGYLTNQTKSSPVQFTCHTSRSTIEMSCSTISLTFRRDLQVSDVKKVTSVHVVALAKGPCMDDSLQFKCTKDYPTSCINKKLKCNGRSECESGDDERDCHAPSPSGMPIIVFILIVLAFLFLLCVASLVCICCCCRTAFNGITRRFRARKEQQKNNLTTTGEDAVLMKELTAPTATIEISSGKHSEPAPLVIDSTKPIYPRLE